jgi:hypothetical protein
MKNVSTCATWYIKKWYLFINFLVTAVILPINDYVSRKGVLRMLYEELRLSGVPTSLRSIYKKGFSGKMFRV